ncbi:hypothetical protein [Mycolicibacterium fortuitum]|uniref:hypothetical protein n=1 Tax=Mycolicibacterium fortuitum TaxID=1766 RepID=UPI002606E294|nr:hypothetical protein [Mycolicibacterium fortuitum]
MQSPKRDVRLEIPSGLFGRNPAGLIEYLGLHGTVAEGDFWLVRPTADAEPALVPHLMAGKNAAAENFSVLSRINPEAPALDTDAVAQVDGTRQRLIRRATSETNEDLAALFHHMQLEILVASHAELPAVVQQVHAGLGMVRFQASQAFAFPDRSVHLVSANERLMRICKLPSILFRIEQDPDVIDRVTPGIGVGDSPQEVLFASATTLFNGYVELARYLGPLMGCLSPRFWSFHGQRSLSIVLFNLGRDLSGVRMDPMELLQLLPISGIGRHTPVSPAVGPASYDIAVNWWISRLNTMFGYLCDLRNFANSKGVYSPREHAHWLLTFDQVFSVITSLQAGPRDHTSQRIAMFGMLDAFADRLTGWSLELLCSQEHAAKVAADVRVSMPAEAAHVLMPMADRAVAALGQVQEGFFIKRQTNASKIHLVKSDGTKHQMTPDAASARLLKIYRNATHGFGGRSSQGSREQQELDTSVLLHHEGILPGDIVYLPFLYLLSLLCNPQRIETKIASACRKR